MPTSRFHRTAAMMLLVIGGCGELANQDTRPPALATMHGSLRLASAADVPQGNIRVALIWHLRQDDTAFSDGPAPEPSADWPCDAYLDSETRMYVTP